MISINKLFLINESRLWSRLSISNVAGPAIRLGRSLLTSNQKIQTSENIQSRLTPKPSRSVGLGFKRVRSYIHPANLP